MGANTPDYDKQLAPVLDAIKKEFEYQDRKFGTPKFQSLPGYLVIIEGEIQSAKYAWLKNIGHERCSPLEELLHAVAVGLRCLMRYGVSGSAFATDDFAPQDESLISYHDQQYNYVLEKRPGHTYPTLTTGRREPVIEDALVPPLRVWFGCMINGAFQNIDGPKVFQAFSDLTYGPFHKNLNITHARVRSAVGVERLLDLTQPGAPAVVDPATPESSRQPPENPLP